MSGVLEMEAACLDAAIKTGNILQYRRKAQIKNEYSSPKE